MKKAPLISVLIPYYNDKEFLKESIDSVLAQSCGDFELLLLNHASTDGSRDIARSYTDERIVHIDLHKNFGAGGGLLLREFLNKMQGKYVKFFCADDIMLPDCLRVLSDYLESHKGKDIVFADLKYVDKDGTETGDTWSKTRPHFCFSLTDLDIFKLLVNGVNPLPYPTVMVRKEVLAQAYIDDTAVIMFDMFLWASMVVNGAHFGFIYDIVALYRQHADQICTSKKYAENVQSSGFESYVYTRIFYNIENEEFIRYLCARASTRTDFDMQDRDNVRFAVAMFYMRHGEHLYRTCGYLVLHAMLHDPAIRRKLIQNFDFDVDTLRTLYRSPYKHVHTAPTGLKGYLRGRLQGKSPLELNTLEIGIVLLRKIYLMLKRPFVKDDTTPKYTV